jgi:hypothetical protein
MESEEFGVMMDSTFKITPHKMDWGNIQSGVCWQIAMEIFGSEHATMAYIALTGTAFNPFQNKLPAYSNQGKEEE